MDTASNNEGELVKKSVFDDLTKDELINKCKGLLVIAQKAKQSNADFEKELEERDKQIDIFLKEKKSDEEDLRTLQELVDSLTEQKLNYITQLDLAQSKVKADSIKCESLEEELKKYKAEITVVQASLSELRNKTSHLDNENISLKRQNDRLLEENENLIAQLSELESKTIEFNEIGLQQREQLRIIEESVNQGTLGTKDQVAELKSKVEGLEDEIKTSKENEIQVKQKIIENEEKIEQATRAHENEKERNEKLNAKLRIYKEKIIRCGTCITQLKNSRFILLKTVKDYSEVIPKWQDDILKVSKILQDEFIEVNNQNNFLKKQLEDMEKTMSKLNQLTENLNNDKLQLEVKNNELSEIIKSVSNEKQESSKEILENVHLQIKALESEKLILIKEKQNARDNIIELENQNKLLSEHIVNVKVDLDSVKAKLETAIHEKAMLERNQSESDFNENQSLKYEIRNLQEQCEYLKKENEGICDLNGLLRDEVETLKISLEQPKDDNLSDLNVSLQADIAKLETKLAAYKQENSSLLIEVKESRIKLNELNTINADYDDVKSKLASYKTENTELLNEMKEINQVLKERGESISKQQKAITEMERLIETLERDRETINQCKNDLEKHCSYIEKELNEIRLINSQQNDETDQIIAERDALIRALADRDNITSALKEEVEKLKQHHNASSELPNEDMSTSTLSRADEHSRMKDLDDTFEEKYTKLRIFALKLKRKVNDMTVQLQNSEEDKAKLERMLSENATSVKNVQTLQQQNDSIVDQLEEKIAEIKALKKINSQMQQQQDEGNNRDVVRINAESMSNEKVNMLEQQVKLLTKELEAARNTGHELDKVKSELAAKQLQLDAEVEQHKIAKDGLEKARRDVKKKSVLSLEMEDYERSMKDLTHKMDENKKKMVQMESTIDAQQGTINAMKTQIKLLEDQVKSEEKQNRLNREELQNATEEVKEKESVIEAKNEVISKLEQDIETARRVYEDLNIEMTTILSEKEKAIIGLCEDKIDLNNRLKRVEIRCSDLEESLKITNIELEDLKTEHSGYKVRAQAVLRQNQTVDHSQEERLREEAAALRAQTDQLKTQLNSAQQLAEDLRAAVEGERRRAAEATAETTRAAQRSGHLQADLSRVTAQLDTERSQHKLQISTLTQCYKTQLSELENKLHRETEELRRELSAAQERLKSSVGLKSSANGNSEAYMLPVISNKDDSDVEMEVNVSMLPREEGEGSESAPSPPSSRPYLSSVGGGGRSPVSLERLLEEGVPEDDVLDSSALHLSPEQELQDARQKLHMQIQRVKHVTVLLEEAERESARYAQMNELLKAEVRRARGSLERSQHAHNAEYMKNVTLKFVTLPPGDERSRLVPVLQKILTLNPEETHQLTAVAKGVDPSSGRGWGSFLPWPGGK